MDFAKPNPKDNPYFYIAEVIPGKSDDVESDFMYYGNGLDYYIDFDSDNILDTPMIRFQSLDLAYTFGELFYSSRPYTPNLQEVTLLSYYIEGVIEGDITVGSMLDKFDMYYREETDAMNGNGFSYGNHTYYFELRLGCDEEDRPIDYNIDELILVHHYAYEDKVIINPTAQEMVAFFNGEIEGNANERYDG